MPTELSSLLPIGGLALAFGAVPLAARLLWLGRRPCPHCGRRSSRMIHSVDSVPGGVRPRSLVYRCRACGGAMRYARDSRGHEYWEAVAESGRASA